MKIKKSDLQIYLGQKIVESKMTKSSKVQMLEFIQNDASTHQLMYLASEGKIAKIDTAEKKKLVEQKFLESEYILEMSEESAVVLAVLGSAVGSIIARQILKNKSDWYKCIDRCKGVIGYTGSLRKRQCYEACRVKSLEAKIAIMKQALAKCPGAKNPEKCQAKIKAKIEKLNTKLIKRKSLVQ